MSQDTVPAEPRTPVVYAVDYETFYRKGKKAPVSITEQGLEQYCRHPEFDAYLVSIRGSDGVRIVDRPERVNWSFAEGQTLVSHNAHFDAGICRILHGLGKHPEVRPARWECSSDLSAFFGSPIRLDHAAKTLLGIDDVSKAVRDELSGVRFENLSEEDQKRVIDYADRDAEISLALWTKLSDKWPDHEREISRLTRESAWRGLRIDIDGVRADIEHLLPQLAERARQMPWVKNFTDSDVAELSDDEGEEADQHYASPLSSIALKKQILKDGVQPPSSFAKNNQEFLEWEAANQHITYVKATAEFRSINMLLQKYLTLQRRCLGDRFGYELKYGGGHTLRDSGGGGLNVQNMPSGTMFGVEFRRRVIADDGCELIAGDLSAIEPRSASYLAGDREMLALSLSYKDWYEVQARAWGLHTDPEPLKQFSDRRRRIKGLNIGLGYGMHYKTYAAKSGKPYHEAVADVDWWRSKNSKIIAVWDKLLHALWSRPGENFALRLRSGRAIHYRSIQRLGQHRVTALVKTDKSGLQRRTFSGGALFENLVQAFSRDVYMHGVLLAKKKGFPILLRVHDEVVTQAKASEIKEAKAELCRCLETPPEWASDLPLVSEAGNGATYADAK